MESGTLFVVATPIGNREDIAPRARRILGEVDLIAAEDTRHTGRFLSHIGIKTPLIAVHEHNEEEQAGALIQRLLGGESLALVSDAGTPLVSDPGYRLVAAAHAAAVPVSPIPGPSAVISALSAAGLPTDRFCFEGFLPAKAEARRALLRSLSAEQRTLVFLESVHKIRASLADLAAILGPDRLAFVGRELTKIHEQCVRETLGTLSAALDDGRITPKGEFVLVVAGAQASPPEGSHVSAQQVLDELLPVMPGRQAVDIAAKLSGTRRNEVYEKMLKMKS